MTRWLAGWLAGWLADCAGVELGCHPRNAHTFRGGFRIDRNLRRVLWKYVQLVYSACA